MPINGKFKFWSSQVKRLSTAILLIATSSIINASELSKDEMTNLNVCEKKSSGVAKYSKSILDSVQTLRFSGLKTVVSKSGSNLEYEFGIGKEKVTIELTKMDSGELSQDNIICYEAQKVIGKDGSFSREDETLNIHTMNTLRIFGGLEWTKQEQREDKSRRANKVAMAKLELEEKQAKEKASALKRQQELDDLQEVRNLERKDERAKKKALRKKKKALYKLVKKLTKFEKDYSSLSNKDKRNKLILTDEYLDEIVDTFTKLADEPLGYTSKENKWNQKIIAMFDRYYDYSEEDRVSNQGGFINNALGQATYQAERTIKGLIDKMK